MTFGGVSLRPSRIPAPPGGKLPLPLSPRSYPRRPLMLMDSSPFNLPHLELAALTVDRVPQRQSCEAVNFGGPQE